VIAIVGKASSEATQIEVDVTTPHANMKFLEFLTAAASKASIDRDGSMVLAGDITLSGGDIVATAVGDVANVFATTTAAVSLGNGPVNIGKDGTATTIDGTLTVAEASTFTGDATFGGAVVASTTADPANVFATTTGTLTLGGGPVNIGNTGSATTIDGTLTVAEASTFTGDATFGGAIVASSTAAAANVFATTTGIVSLGDGPVNIGKAGSATTIDGTLTVTEATTLSKTLGLTPSATGVSAFTITGAGLAVSDKVIAIVGKASSEATQIEVDVTTPHANMKFLEFLTAGTSKASIDRDGNMVLAGDITLATLTVGSNQVVGTQQSAVSDVAATNDPGDGVVGALSISGTYTQSEGQALRDEVEKLRDFANDLRTQLNSVLSAIRAHGLIAT